MSATIRELKRRKHLMRIAAFRAKRRLQLGDMAEAHRMAAEGYGREELHVVLGLPMATCREIVFGKRSDAR